VTLGLGGTTVELKPLKSAQNHYPQEKEKTTSRVSIEPLLLSEVTKNSKVTQNKPRFSTAEPGACTAV